VVLIDVATGEFGDVNISGSNDEVDLRAPAFSPDGRFVAYTRTGYQEKP
jgi:WD40-like Beta Propeller Repeat